MEIGPCAAVTELAGSEEWPSVSIHIPTERVGGKENEIRFKNMLAVASATLRASGLKIREAEGLLEPLEELARDQMFWHTQHDGFSAFVSPTVLLHCLSPGRLPESAVVASRFQLKSLLPFCDERRFVALALSQGAVRVLDCTQYGEREVEIEGMPASLEDALRYDDPERQLQYHTGNPGGRTAIFHGSDGIADAELERLTRFCQLVDGALVDWLGAETPPLVLAGVERVCAVYREASRYAGIAKADVRGSEEQARPEEIRAKAWEILEPSLFAQRQRSLENYEALIGQGRASSDPAVVVPAAYNGRIETLWAAADRTLYGALNRETATIELTDKPTITDGDLADLAAVHAWLHGAKVYVVAQAQLPSAGPLAAIMRY